MINPPKTLEEAQAYRYEQSVFNPEGNKYIEGACAYEIELYYQCLRNAKHGPAGLYCKQHARKVEGDKTITLLELAARGRTNKQIAVELELSERTIKNMFSKLYKSMKAENRTHAVTLAMNRGIIKGIEE